MSDYIKTYNSLTDIPERNYQGYIWYSDRPKPEVLESPTKYRFSEVKTNPFVIEALLYSEEENISVMVRHTGSYQIREYNLNKLPEGKELQKKEYFQHRLEIGGKKVCFQQLWLPQEDPNCEYMEVLTLKAHIFTGFSK